MEENVLAGEPQSVDSSAKEKKKNKTRKVIATTTYFIALLCLLAGLFVPLFQFDKAHLPESMMFRYIPSMFNGVFGKEVIKLGEKSYFLPFAYEAGKFNFMSLIGVLYAIVCVIALIMLIPVLLGSKKKNTSARCALGVEVLAMLVTLTYIAYKAYFLVSEHVLEWTDYNFLIAFGGVLLMAIIQTISSKGGIGVSKVIGLVLTVIAVIALLDITLFIPKLADPLGDKAGLLTFNVREGEAAGAILGTAGIAMLLDAKGTGENFKLLFELYKKDTKLGVNFLLEIFVEVFVIAIVLLTVVNLVFDVIGLSTGKKYKKDRSPCKNGASNTFALVRYILTFLFALTIILIAFLAKDFQYKVGIYLWIFAGILLVSIINAAVRTAVDNARYKKGALAPPAEAQQRMVLSDPAFAAQPLPVAEEFEEPVQEAEAAYEPLPVVDDTPAYEPLPVVDETMYEPLPVVGAEPAAETAPVVEPLSAPLEEPEEVTRTVYIYGGATDEFMDTLTDNEKVEFVELFLKKSKGTVNGVPDYQIDGDNSDFFPAVFVHINRYRNIVSDALMTKMYKQLGKTM